MSSRLLPIAVAAVTLLALTTVASADAIDGTWCSADSRHFSIDGSDFTTPGGAQIQGDYDRHAYSYVVPDNEPDAGKKVDMVLINDNTIHLTVGRDANPESPVEVWHRCELTT